MAGDAGVLKLGCIADDLTGASDLANALVSHGLRTVQTIGIPAGPPPSDCDAVVVALKSRSIAPHLAVNLSLSALAWLREAGCERVFFKYCSTFDSTPRGNIGPVLEALASELGASAVIACPAFPAAARTVYQGHLFVGDRLLSESGMRDHPITPMRDPDLVRVLQAQMRGPVGLVSHAELAGGHAAARLRVLADQGAAAVIADAIDDADLAALGELAAAAPLSSGGSGLGAGIARALSSGAAGAPAPLPAGATRRAIVAGSCSQATCRQLALARERYPSMRVELSAEETVQAAIDRVRTWVDAQGAGAPVLVYSSGSPEEVAAQRAARPGDVAEELETVLAEVSAHLAERVDALIVAGGETSGAVVQRLGVDQLAIGPEIDPGVPWTIGRRADGRSLLLALKSGNFGSDDFLVKAWEHLP